MKTFRFLLAFALASSLLVAPLRAEQGSTVTPVVGPHTMADYAADVNAALLAILSCNSGSSAPANGVGGGATHYQCWADTTTNPVVVKMYDGTSWVIIGKLDTSAHSWASYVGSSAALASASNLSDLASTSTARSNLGVASLYTVAAVAHQWIASVAAGVPSLTQPAFSDLSGSAAVSQIPGILAAQGRLTLTANTPVMTASATAQSTLRYDCYVGAYVPYYTGSADAVDTIASCEVTDAMVSAASAGQVVSGNVYDVWWEGNSHHNICLAMSSASGGGGGWSSDTGGSNTVRGTGYSQLDRTTRGYPTNKNAVSNCFNGSTNYGSVAANRLTLLGTVYASANGQISFTFGGSASGGAAALFGVWNMYNRVNVGTNVTDNGTQYSYTSSTYRQARASTGNQAQFVFGLNEDATFFNSGTETQTSAAGGAFALVNVALDNTTGLVVNQVCIGSSVDCTQNAPGQVLAGVGLHTILPIERSDGTNGQNFDHNTANTLSTIARM